jgi:hypothetical protein
VTDPGRSASTSEAELADRVAERVRAVPGVVGLHGGAFGEAATYLPGRRVTGVRMGDGGVGVHVVTEWDRDVREVAAAVRSALSELLPSRPVTVTVEDVAQPGQVEEGPSGGRG